MRKDIECVFGILKQKFSILRNGIKLGKIKNCDDIWLTCCALHNILLKLDGLDTNWDTSQYTNQMNIINSSNNISQPFALNRLKCRISLQNNNFDDHEKIDNSIFDCYTEDGYRIISKIPFDMFRKALIHHFDIRFHMNTVCLPKTYEITCSYIYLK